MREWELNRCSRIWPFSPLLSSEFRTLTDHSSGVFVEWSNKPLPMYTLKSGWVQVGFRGFHRLWLTWSHFHFLKQVSLACQREWNNALQQLQPSDASPRATHCCRCILAFSYCRTGSKISWHSLVCSFLLSPSISFQLAVGSWTALPNFSGRPFFTPSALGPQFCVFSLSSEDWWRRDPTPLYLVVLRIRLFSWAVVQVFFTGPDFHSQELLDFFFFFRISFVFSHSLCWRRVRYATGAKRSWYRRSFVICKWKKHTNTGVFNWRTNQLTNFSTKIGEHPSLLHSW